MSDTKKPYNPPLFYQAIVQLDRVYETEITLRDLLVAFAMAGLLAHPCCDMHGPTDLKENARYAFELADAALAEREKRQETQS